MSSYLTIKRSEEFKFEVMGDNFITFLGESNSLIVNDLMFPKENDGNIDKLRKTVNFVVNDYLNVYLGETVKDEIAYGMENLGISRNEMNEKIFNYARMYSVSHLLDKDPSSLGISDKVKVKIISALVCNPKVLVLYEVLSELDYIDKILVNSLLKEYINEGKSVINFTSDVSECLYGNYVVVCNKDKILIEGETISVLNEEKIMKRLGIGLPFIIELNKYFMDYDLIKNYETDMSKLVDVIWK